MGSQESDRLDGHSRPDGCEEAALGEGFSKLAIQATGSFREDQQARVPLQAGSGGFQNAFVVCPLAREPRASIHQEVSLAQVLADIGRPSELLLGDDSQLAGVDRQRGRDVELGSMRDHEDNRPVRDQQALVDDYEGHACHFQDLTAPLAPMCDAFSVADVLPVIAGPLNPFNCAVAFRHARRQEFQRPTVGRQQRFLFHDVLQVGVKGSG